MARRKRFSTAGPAGSAAAVRQGKTTASADLGNLWAALTKPRQTTERFKPEELTFILSTLSTLVQNGVPLPRALGTLGKESAMAKHSEVLETLRRKVESGVPFSSALSQFPHLCDRLTVNQIRLGERSGTLGDTLKKLSGSRNKTAELKQQVVKKLAYPGLLIVVGSGLITFLLLYVVPVFEQTYSDAGVPLPFITQVLIGVGALARRFGLVIVATVVISLVTIKQLRKRDDFALRMDRALIRMPMLGPWFRDMAVLQLMEVLQNLMEAGYTLAEALRETADSVSNRAVKQGVHNLQRAVQRGERFSLELERHEGMFPPIVNQLVIIGESTGQLTRATTDICEYLRKEIERKTSLMVGALEPILTISLAMAIAVVLLAIYLPMFDMVNTIS
ncbi:MAG: type II secretion system F family protein [Planctomycetes bacterium]|nr:type II secretion system F family protein [Planctomycetota bacterium]